MNVDRKTCKAYENPQNPSRCPLRIYENKVSKLSPKADGGNAFYLRRDMVQTIIGAAGFKGSFVLLHHDCFGQTFSNSQYGNRLGIGRMRYLRSEQKRSVSSVLQGQQICFRGKGCRLANNQSSID